MEVFYCSLQLYLSGSFLFDLLLHGLGSFRHRLSSGQLFLHESQALILLMEACQFVFDDSFDLLFPILMLILLSFSLLMLKWWLNAWPEVFMGGGAPPPGLLIVPVALWVLWFLPLQYEALRMFVVGWLFGLFGGPNLRPLGMSLQPKSLF
jgi:hypothetical protein